MNKLISKLIRITKEIHVKRYPRAKVVFLAGSIVRGEGTPYSDLDLVVVFENLPNAFRETFFYEHFPVEAFVHDLETLNYFMSESDRQSGFPVMINMILEGIEIPEKNRLSETLKQAAAFYFEQGPEPLSSEKLLLQRYTITNLVDDIRAPRSREELIASGADLYQALANFFCRSNNYWSAKSKSIPRVLCKTDADLADKYATAFEKLFVDANAQKVIELAAEILEPTGGFAAELEKLDAPVTSRKPFA